MKQNLAVLLAFSLSCHLMARNHDDGDLQGRQRDLPAGQASRPKPAQAPPRRHAPAKPAQVRRQARINLGHEAAPRNAETKETRRHARPAAGNVLHSLSRPHHEEGRERLRALGVKKTPEPIAKRSHILDTDRAHSVISLPQRDDRGRALHHELVDARHWNDPVVRTHMGSWNNHVRVETVLKLNQVEAVPGRYYWHHDAGFDYCHYYDRWGYHWYGWYVGPRQFWTRYYADRWWFYDSGFNRWCFWNDGFWWWQDPYHVGDLYVYDDDKYVPAEPEGEPVVSTVESADLKSFRSPDGTRLVKIMGDSHDAFLYDTAIPPSFNPQYLASKAVSAGFSDGSKGPLRITLTLSDGSSDVFDSQGLYLDTERD
jgi:hypothetical protein